MQHVCRPLLTSLSRRSHAYGHVAVTNRQSVRACSSSSSSRSGSSGSDADNNGSGRSSRGDSDAERQAATARRLRESINASAGLENSDDMSQVCEEQVYGRYLSVYDRKVQFTDQATGKTTVVDYDVVGHPRANFFFTVVLPFHPAKDGRPAQVTLISEYCQGPGELGFCLPGGQYDAEKHGSIADAARAELSEEAMLEGGELVRLIGEDHPGMVEVKWCRNRFVPFLVIDPKEDLTPGDRDTEEHLLQVHRVDFDEFLRLIAEGNMMLPSISTAFLAIQALKKRGLLPPET